MQDSVILFAFIPILIIFIVRRRQRYNVQRGEEAPDGRRYHISVIEQGHRFYTQNLSHIFSPPNSRRPTGGGTKRYNFFQIDSSLYSAERNRALIERAREAVARAEAAVARKREDDFSDISL